jgi:hypothetical protein
VVSGCSRLRGLLGGYSKEGVCSFLVRVYFVWGTVLDRTLIARFLGCGFSWGNVLCIIYCVWVTLIFDGISCFVLKL